MEFLSYEFLRFIWWILIIVLWLGFAIAEGFDMGGTMLLPFLGKTDEERRVVVNALAPHWDGNQVWFILAAGALFAAWPILYATAFSGLYAAFMIILFSLFLRPMGFDYRSKLESPKWRNFWDWALFVPGIVPPLLMGVAVGNLFLGLPFEFDTFLRSTYEGGLLGLLHPFTLIAGLLGVTMFAMQGASYIMLRSDNDIYLRAQAYLSKASLASIVLFALGGLYLYFLPGYSITSEVAVAGPSNPTLKTVEIIDGAWLNNYSQYPITILAPLIAFAGMGLAFVTGRAGKASLAFLGTSLTLIGIIVTAAASLFPFIMPSSKVPAHSLTMWDATSSELTLNIMFWCAMVFVPLILAYTSWCYYSLWGKLTTDFIRKNDHSLY